MIYLILGFLEDEGGYHVLGAYTDKSDAIDDFYVSVKKGIATYEAIKLVEVEKNKRAPDAYILKETK